MISTAPVGAATASADTTPPQLLDFALSSTTIDTSADPATITLAMRLSDVISGLVPKSVIQAKSALYLKRGQPARRSQVINYGDYDIVRIYGAEYRGMSSNHLLAGDVRRLHRLRWVMLSSMLKTLAAKHRSTATKIERSTRRRS